jgi:integrase
MAVVKLTERFLANAKPTTGKATTRYFDKDCTGLCARVGANAISFYAQTIGGQWHRIGRYPEWTLAEARRRAQEIRRAVAAGEGPAPIRKPPPTLSAAFDDFAAVQLMKRGTRTARDYQAQMRQHVFPKWGARPINALTRSDIVDIHAALTRAGSPTRANRVVATISSLFGFLQRDRGYTGGNPAAGIKKNPEHGREVFLTAVQVRDALAAIERYVERGDGRAAGSRSVANCLTFVIATGCRSHEAKSAQWSEFDDDLTVWVKAAPDTKQRRAHRRPLNDMATEILQRRRDARHNGPYVFPGRHGDDHVKQLRAAWSRIRKDAGLPDGVRIHDLRHSFASLALHAGASLPLIGKLLGHSNVRTTARYSHLLDADLRAAVGKVNALIEGKQGTGDE